MRVKPQLIYQRERNYQTNSGYLIRVKMKLQKLPNIQKKEFPQDYKFSWVAYSLENTSEQVLFDNHHGKTPHFHIDKVKPGTYFTWISREKAENLFWEKVQERFGILKSYDKK